MTEKHILGNIVLISDIVDFDFYQYNLFIQEAVNFLIQKLNIKKHEFNVDIIVPNNYNDTLRKYYYTDDIKDSQSNASTINRFSLNKEIEKEKDVIIINWNLARCLDDHSIISILVHELLHHIDFIQIDLINAAFEIELFGQNENESKLCETLRFFFMGRTEMRAFYFDELYLRQNGRYTQQIDQVKEITNEYRTMSFILPRLLGKIRCWQEQNCLPDMINEANQYISTADKECSDWATNISNSFEFVHFMSLCRQISKLQN